MKWFKSWAKINRFLYIIDKLPNGYHEIITLFEKITLCDEIGLNIEKASNRQIKIKCPDWLPKDVNNLAYKAAQLFMEASGLNLAIEIKILKNIPAGGGLGGGSSNAAVTLNALNDLTDRPLSEKKIYNLCEQIGADCPFFLTDWIRALGTGTGTKLQRVDFEELNWYVLVFPDFPVSTKWAYENFELTRRIDKTIFEPRNSSLNKIWENDLEKPVTTKYPIIKQLKEQLVKTGASQALMSGSGSTVFGVFSSEKKALEAKEKLNQHYNYKIIVTKTLTK